jgi:hypothetical protein
MNFAHTLAHILVPRPSNNFKAKLLHAEFLAILLLFAITLRLVLFSAPIKNTGVLGYSANIPPEKVVELTNLARVNAGLNTLTINKSLEEAARQKGQHMLEYDYWSHVAPDGTEPWDFFAAVGYDYRYAGENLARDFSNPQAAIEAWIASPTHRDNMLSGKYNEIGIAVVEGDMNGVDTTIIVQLFGTKSLDTVPVVPVASANTSQETDKQPIPAIAPAIAQAGEAPESESHEGVVPSSKSANGIGSVSPFNLLRAASLGVALLLSIVLVIDVVVISRKRVARNTSKPLAHISFLSMVILLIWLAQAGKIL